MKVIVELDGTVYVVMTPKRIAALERAIKALEEDIKEHKGGVTKRALAIEAAHTTLVFMLKEAKDAT